ncbi:helix-turn-helix transcriptional regulator [Leekyejoonella antrihumi]|uniref:YafY family transcriptional regulator n=1 Tax=Leekyejoonella antrihumi TaxID=1660198 RepID=A0A563E9Q7_9MICO|nr:YafY family protein [Leekyejoonella antrihumi]TWP38992.1 YafY family transcriptional regulator [Leekyejoonella antrihumi]
MAETTARLLRLLGLLQARSVWTGDELAQRLGVTQRSVRRDVDRLRELGYPVQASRGIGGGYQLGAGRALPPLLLDQDEAVAVAVCLRLAAGGTVAGVGEAAVRTMAKLDQVLPAALRAQVAAVQEATVTIDYRPSPVDPAHLLELASAIRRSVQARFEYVAADGAETSRRLEPYRLVATGRRWYLFGFDLDRDDWRIFRLDRMSEVRAGTFRFTVREAPGAETYLRRSRHGEWRYTARLRVHASAEETATHVGSWATVEEFDASTCLVTLGGDDIDRMAWWLARLALDFEVVDPTELRDAFHRLADRAADLAGRGSAL